MRPIDIRKYKQELRAGCRERRTGMDPQLKKSLDKDIADNVRRLKEYRPAKTILIYMSTPIEVDTVEIIKNAWADGKRVAVPRCIPDSRDMEFHYIDSFDCLAPGTFSVLEPDPSLPRRTLRTSLPPGVPALSYPQASPGLFHSDSPPSYTESDKKALCRRRSPPPAQG